MEELLLAHLGAWIHNHLLFIPIHVCTHGCLNLNSAYATPMTPVKPRNKTSGNKQTGKHQQLRHRRNGAQLSRPTLSEIIRKYILECPAQYIFEFTQRTTTSPSPQARCHFQPSEGRLFRLSRLNINTPLCKHFVPTKSKT